LLKLEKMGRHAFVFGMNALGFEPGFSIIALYYVAVA